jgi:asparagine synthase (glutamine-hydrolysing)
MANSLELRLPFLDYRVIDFAMGLPPAWKIKVLNEKHILKETFREQIPSSIVSRPKHPYRAPIRDVFFGGGNGYAREFLSRECLEKTGYFDPVKTGHLVRRFIHEDGFAASETQNMALVGILSTQILHHQYIEGFNWGSVEPAEVDKIVDRRIVRKTSG